MNIQNSNGFTRGTIPDASQFKKILEQRRGDPRNLPPARRQGKKTRFFLDNEIFENGYVAILPPPVLAVYCALAMHAHQSKQSCFPSIARIINKTGITSKNTVVKAIKILESLNMICVARSRGRNSNLYLMVDSAYWRPANSINGDTVRGGRKIKMNSIKNRPTTVLKNAVNSINGDTRNLIKKSDNEILSLKNKNQNDFQ